MCKKQRLPHWLIKKKGSHEQIHNVKSLLRGGKLHTVCESARCPNLGECFANSTATFMILGNICTRKCGFCAVSKGNPLPIDPNEPVNVARASVKLGLNYVVVTSVTRDDLQDGGAGQFYETVKAIRELLPAAKIEILTPDFEGKINSINKILEAAPNIFNHNIETVPQLYHNVRPQADYRRSLELLKIVKDSRPEIKTKSGIMLGLGENRDQVIQTLADLRQAGCDLLTIGQYLQPSRESLPVIEYIEPAEFENYKKIALDLGFIQVMSHPFARSSYHADDLQRA